MERTITVQGTATLSAKPDTVVLTLNISARSADYAKASDESNTQAEALKTALGQAGLDANSLKTTNLSVSAEYQTVSDEQGNFQRVFTGYLCLCTLRTDFELDMELLGKTITAINQSGVCPEFSLDFTVKNPAALKEALLQKAAAEARENALILCRASGVTLGRLIHIDYNWGERGMLSATRCALKSDMAFSAGAVNFIPEDIEFRESAAFTWEIS